MSDKRGAVRVTANQLDSAVREILNAYQEDAKVIMEEVALECGDGCANELKAVSPKRKGRGQHYANGWRCTRMVAGRTKYFYGVVVHNKTKAGLAHLLEKGHNGAKADGTAYFVPPKVHIKPVEERFNAEYLRKMKERLEKW